MMEALLSQSEAMQALGIGDSTGIAAIDHALRSYGYITHNVVTRLVPCGKPRAAHLLDLYQSLFPDSLLWLPTMKVFVSTTYAVLLIPEAVLAAARYEQSRIAEQREGEPYLGDIFQAPSPYL